MLVGSTLGARTVREPVPGIALISGEERSRTSPPISGAAYGVVARPMNCATWCYLSCKEVMMETATERRNFKLFGEAHPNAKLTRAEVVQIREEIRVPGTSRAWLAKKFGVSRTTIDNIISGQTWRDAE